MDIFTPIADNKFKLSFGNRNLESYESIFESNYDIEEFDIFLELSSDDDVQKLKRIFQLKGNKVKKLFWSNWCKHALSSNDVVELLNTLPNLKFVQFSAWQTEFAGVAVPGSLELTNLCCVEIRECKNFIFDFLSIAVPENKLKCLKIGNVNDADDEICALINKHESIKRLNLSGAFVKLDTLMKLKLESFRYILIEKTDKTDNQRAFLKELIKSQTELTSLDLLNDMDYSFNFVDDAVLTDIGSLSKLQNLHFNIDGISSNTIKSIAALTSLKTLEIKTNRDQSLPAFKELSSIKNSSVEKLILKLWSFEIPAKVYSAFGENFSNLKSLKITLGTRHKVNFFIKALPKLEELNVRFGESNNPVEFSQAYDNNDDVKNSSLKSLRLSFWGSEMVNIDNFFKFLNMFESLTKLDIDSKFPFTSEFVSKLPDKLNTINSLKFQSFSVKNEETFQADIIEAFKNLRTKLKYASFTFSNIQSVDFGNGPQRGEQGECHTFTFKPFILALKDVYKAKECGFSNIRIHNNLILTAEDKE